jgi:tetratricopeptide (TPR) repeat protein
MAYAQTAHVRILRGAAPEGAGQLLYCPFVEAIRRELTHQPLDRVRQQLGPLAHDLARLLPELASGATLQHTLIRQALYQKLAAERRAWLHEQVAKAIEAMPGSQPDEQASVLAYHYEQAGDPIATLQYLVRAGDWARRAYALQEALEHYTRALEYARRPYDEHDAGTVISLLERRSQTEPARSNFDAAIGDLEQLLTLYQERGQRTREGETLFQIGFAHYWAHRLVQASAYLDQALAIADALDYRELRAGTAVARHPARNTGTHRGQGGCHCMM